MAQNGKLRPNLDQQSTKLLNLTVLQRIDPFIDEILITATHVTFYEFNTDLSEWVCFFIFFCFFIYKFFLSFSDCVLLIFCGFSNFQSRKDVEGSLFVVKRWFSLYYVDGFWIVKFGVVCFGVNFYGFFFNNFFSSNGVKFLAVVISGMLNLGFSLLWWIAGVLVSVFAFCSNSWYICHLVALLIISTGSFIGIWQ